MLFRVFTAFIVIVAVVVGILNISSSHVDVLRLSMFSEFFNVALPILGFGALVKYLCSRDCMGNGRDRCTCGGKCSCGSGRCCCGARESMPRT